MTRADIRTRFRDYIFEDIADLFSAPQVNRFYEEETRSLPTKGVFRRQLWTHVIESNQQEYILPTGTVGIEKTEINYGSTTPAHWVELSGCQFFADALFLPYTPGSGNDTIRAWLNKTFTVVSDDLTALDIPDDMSEVLVWGMVVRGYKRLIGFYRNSKNFDSVTTPNGVTLSVIQGWFREGKQEYKDLISQYAIQKRTREIDLVS